MDICLTGASRGLGEALCRSLVRAGHRVWGVARNRERLEVLARDLGDSFRWSLVDVTDAASLVRWREELRAAGFNPSVLILNASVQENDMEGSYDHAAGRRVLQINLDGALACVEQFLPDFLAKKKGRIVAISSTVALRPSVRSASYAASKAGLAMAMRTLRLRYAGSGVQFPLVTLGPIATAMWEGKKNSLLVPSAESAAARIAEFVCSSFDGNFYYPFLSTFLLRLSLFLPDRWFVKVSTMLLR